MFFFIEVLLLLLLLIVVLSTAPSRFLMWPLRCRGAEEGRCNFCLPCVPLARTFVAAIKFRSFPLCERCSGVAVVWRPRTLFPLTENDFDELEENVDEALTDTILPVCQGRRLERECSSNAYRV